MGVGGDDDIAAEHQPLLQNRIGREEILAETAVHRRGVDLQHATVAGGGHQRGVGGGGVAGVILIKELAVTVDLLDQVEVAQDRGLLLGNLGHIGKVSLNHGQRIAVKIVVDAGAQILLAPVNLIILAGLGPLDIVRAADPVVVLGRVIVAEQIPFQAAQNVQLAGVALLQLGDLRLVQGGTALGHAIFQITGGVAVSAEAQRLQTVPPCRDRNLVQRVLTVAQFGMNVYRAFQVFACHSYCILSCLTLWSITCRFSSSFVMSSTEMPSSIISTMTW